MEYPKFIDNSSFYHMDRSRSDLEQLIAISENLKAVHLLTAKHYEDFEQLIAEYLKSGIEIFQMQTGIVSHISEDKVYTVKDVISNLDVINPGDEYELEGTYCREVYATRKTIGFPCIGEIKELKDHPVYVNLKLESYLSAPIFVNNKIYGTLNFTSLVPRKHGFSEHENDLVSIMAQSIGNFILLQEKEEKLKKANLRMQELIGYVAHDLRNPIGGINSLSRMALSKNLSEEKRNSFFELIEEESSRSLELVNTILEQAALGTGKIVLDKSEFNVSEFIDTTLQTLALLIKEKRLTITKHIDDDLEMYADKARISQVFRNLLINAFKYCSIESEVIINCTRSDALVHCSILNTIANDVNSLDSNIYKSIGYGLDIVDDILKLHNTQLVSDQNQQSYHVSFDIDSSK